jgi:rhodanese-related sulfurtransferase
MVAYDHSRGYAGDVSVTEAWDLLSREQTAQLVDVRTTAEWAYVGQPDLAPIGRTVHRIEWQMFPSMAVNPDFVTQAGAALGADKTMAVFFLCRSGVRSRAAAIAMTAAGYTKSFNIAGGFEGDLDEARHRGKTNGWKAAGLPWTQS